MYTIKTSSHFSSAHNLREYKGKCEDVHGHNWKVELGASAEKTGPSGMVIDFKDLRALLFVVLEELDHTFQNELDHFKEHNPTSENIARYIFERASSLRPELNVSEVTVWETENSSATYSRQNR